MLDVVKIVTEKAQALVDDGVVSGLIEKAVHNAIVSALDDYNIKSTLEKAIEEQIKVDLQNLNLPMFGNVICKVVQAKATELMTAEAQRVGAVVEELMTPAPAKITVSELYERWVEFARDDKGESEGHIDFTFTVKQSHPDSSCLREWYTIYADLDHDKNNNDCEYRIDVRDGGKIHRIYSRWGGDSDKLLLGRSYDFSKQLIQMYAAGTLVEVDETYFSQEDYTD